MTTKERKLEIEVFEECRAIHLKTRNVLAKIKTLIGADNEGMAFPKELYACLGIMLMKGDSEITKFIDEVAAIAKKVHGDDDENDKADVSGASAN